MKKILFISVILLTAIFNIDGQDIDRTKYIQIDGLTLNESGIVVPNVGIYSFKLRRGAASNNKGIFSIISTPGDTVFFTLPGYRPTLLTIPEELSSVNYTTDIHIIKDTITIDEVVVLPWKTYTEFKKAVMNTNMTSPEVENMRFNIALVKQQLNESLKATPGEGYQYTMQQMADNLYTRGQFPANNLLNPMAWNRFIQGVRHGLLKNSSDTHKKATRAKTKFRKKKTVR